MSDDNFTKLSFPLKFFDSNVIEEDYIQLTNESEDVQLDVLIS